MLLEIWGLHFPGEILSSLLAHPSSDFRQGQSPLWVNLPAPSSDGPGFTGSPLQCRSSSCWAHVFCPSPFSRHRNPSPVSGLRYNFKSWGLSPILICMCYRRKFYLCANVHLVSQNLWELMFSPDVLCFVFTIICVWQTTPSCGVRLVSWGWDRVGRRTVSGGS